MSFDLEIVTNQQPELAHVNQFFASRNQYQVGGTFVSGNGFVLIKRQTKAGEIPCFTIDGPFQVEVEDIEEEMMAAVSDPHWLIQISIHAGSPRLQRLPPEAKPRTSTDSLKPARIMSNYEVWSCAPATCSETTKSSATSAPVALAMSTVSATA